MSSVISTIIQVKKCLYFISNYFLPLRNLGIPILINFYQIQIDCCPDYEPVCKGIEQTARCELDDGDFMESFETRKVNCNTW